MSDDDGDEESAPLETPNLPTPRENPDLVGQELAEAALLAAYRSGRLPHAWLLAGPRGVGKATLAFRFARFLFAEAGGELFAPPAASLALASDHPVFRRVASGGHPDLLVIERGVDPKRKKLRSEIVVDDTRRIAGFLRLTPAEGHWRVVILDDADLMNRNAANALLKILEEPPQRALLLLASDNPGRLLPTIRSRCRILTLRRLPEALVLDALERYRPDLGAGDRQALARLAEGSIGRALDLAAAGGVALYRNLVKLIAQLPDLDGAQVHALADSVLRGESEDAFRLMSELLPGWVARMVALASGGTEAERAALPGEAEMMRRLAARRGLDQWIDVWEKLTELFARAESVNLDRKQTVLNAFFALEEAAR
ncbi:MAG TPA: DNA polymerase III subunit delta' [Stellaceae bacterium]|nr:DNA polymerase III subunit delta' [Stellaceae bacterium]